MGACATSSYILSLHGSLAIMIRNCALQFKTSDLQICMQCSVNKNSCCVLCERGRVWFTKRIDLFSVLNRLVIKTYIVKILIKKKIVKMVEWYIICVFWSFVCHFIYLIESKKESSHNGFIHYLSPID